MAFGSIKVRITSASIENTLVAINKQGVHLEGISRINELETELYIQWDNLGILKEAVTSYGGETEVLVRNGIYCSLISLRKRLVLVIGLLIYILLALYLPSRILFVQVEGNAHIPSEIILEQAQRAGIGFGASRRIVRSEKIKNALLAQVPELQWAGINTYGCVAVISVKERNDLTKAEITPGVCSIVAKSDGVIDEVIVNRGNVLCKVGQAVRKNQLLVSGYTDCGISIKATAADAEIYARTFHELQLIVPTSYAIKTNLQEQQLRFSLILGKKQIKLYKDSGISDAGCVKMYKQCYLTLPGNFRLPIAIAKETLIFYDIEDRIAQEETLFTLASDIGTAYLREHMLAGEILSSSYAMKTDEAAFKLKGSYSCREMIGEVYSEEIVTADD